MELNLPAAVFARELGLLQGVVVRRTTHQILGNVLLEARDARLTLTATDLDTTFVSEIQPATIKSGGAVTVPARRLYDVVRDLPGTAEIRLKVLDNHHVSIECKEPKLRIRLNGLPASDYPTRPESGGTASASCSRFTNRTLSSRKRMSANSAPSAVSARSCHEIFWTAV